MTLRLALPSIVRNNPIKSTLAFTASSAGFFWIYDYMITKSFMRQKCHAAAIKGDKLLKQATDPVRHVTVLLNPVAGKQRSKKLYQKWVEPLFNLAGMRISVVETDSPNQAYDLMKIMSDCDCVAIVGGDGTVNEALNGFFDRQDWNRIAQELPIAIIPTGKSNTMAQYLYDDIKVRNHKQLLAEAAMRLVEGKTKPASLTKFVPTPEKLLPDKFSPTIFSFDMYK